MRITGKGVWGPPEDSGVDARACCAARSSGRQLHRHRRLLRPRCVRRTDRRDAGPTRRTSSSRPRAAQRPVPAAGSRRPARAPARGVAKAASAPALGRHRPLSAPPARSEGPLEDRSAHSRRFSEQGKIRHVGVSNVTRAARDGAQIVTVVSVQNRYNFADRSSDDVLDARAATASRFSPGPRRAGPARPRGRVHEIARAARAPRLRQVALAWLLARSPVILPIPGTSIDRAPRGKPGRRRARAGRGGAGNARRAQIGPGYAIVPNRGE